MVKSRNAFASPSQMTSKAELLGTTTKNRLRSGRRMAWLPGRNRFETSQRSDRSARTSDPSLSLDTSKVSPTSVARSARIADGDGRAVVVESSRASLQLDSGLLPRSLLGVRGWFQTLQRLPTSARRGRFQVRSRGRPVTRRTSQYCRYFRNFPLIVMWTRSPAGSGSRSTDMLKSMALMMPSPNSS